MVSHPSGWSPVPETDWREFMGEGSGNKFKKTRQFARDIDIIVPLPPFQTTDLLSKYLGTRSFHWPLGKFGLVQSQKYGERLGKAFQRQRPEARKRHLQNWLISGMCFIWEILLQLPQPKVELPKCKSRKCPINYIDCMWTHVVYQITCELCEACYIESTVRTLHLATERIAFAKNQMKASAMGVH